MYLYVQEYRAVCSKKMEYKSTLLYTPFFVTHINYVALYYHILHLVHVLVNAYYVLEVSVKIVHVQS